MAIWVLLVGLASKLDRTNLSVPSVIVGIIRKPAARIAASGVAIGILGWKNNQEEQLKTLELQQQEVIVKKIQEEKEEGVDDYYMWFKKTDEEKTALEIWKDALSNVMPHVEVRSRRVGGATFQIPMQIRPDRKISTAMKWLISFARKRNEKSMALKLASEILAAAKEEGAAVKKRTDTHKMAEANKAFSHFRF